MAIINQETVYGYELSLKLQNYGLKVSEGSIYPVLLRLQKEGLIKGEFKNSPNGPDRKYYFITKQGINALEEFRNNWEKIKVPVDLLLYKEQIP